MGYKHLACVLLLLAPIATAQVSTDEAAARLKARQSARASSQPSDELQVMRQAIRSLQAQVAALREENTALRRQLVDAKKQIPSPTAKKNDLPGILDPNARIKVGMTLDEAIAVMGPTDSVEENGDGSKVVYWRVKTISVTGGGFSGASTSSNSSGVSREVMAQIDAKGIVKDFTDRK